MAAGTGMSVAFRSSRVLITVPSGIRRTMSSSARLRAQQASRSTFTLRQARLTTSLLTAPPNRPNSARVTRLLSVPERQTAAIRAPVVFVNRRQRGSACDRRSVTLPLPSPIRARGTRTVSVPEVPVSGRSRCPWR